MGRTVDACKGCGKQKEIVSGGLCNACRMAADRAPGELPGRYVTAKKKSDAKIRKYLNGLIDNLLGLQEEGYLSPDDAIDVWLTLTNKMPILSPLLKLHRIGSIAKKEDEKSTSPSTGSQEETSASAQRDESALKKPN
jgi:hypothetical protein